MATAAITSTASAERVWDLIARPERWREWSPHVAGAELLGEPEVEAGAEGRVLLRGGLALPARITAVVPGESWEWRVLGLEVGHRVRPLAAGGCDLRMETGGEGPIWAALALGYWPLVALIARNVVRVAER